jgi:hypothetical protein
VASPGCRRGQRGPRCSIHARRNLPDKAFGYLKRVRVTPGVYRPLAQLNPSFRYLHWPGFSDYTHPFGLAVTCVFIKQSGPPCHCDLRSQFFIKTAGIPYTKGTGLVCRVPSPTVYPIHLRLIIQCTCVGSRYGQTNNSLHSISWSPGLEQTHLTASHSCLESVLAITALPNSVTVQ